ncbi:hypothetical protein BDQ17DRAFT_1336422 [Cyathus striatus]|nr:hypothetical protein BDQ17DRAFT_1336422 [Cyathus striatus]
MANGVIVQAEGQWQGTMEIDRVKVEGMVEVFNSGGSWEVLFGKPLMKNFEAVHDYCMDEVTIGKQDEHITLNNQNNLQDANTQRLYQIFNIGGMPNITKDQHETGEQRSRMNVVIEEVEDEDAPGTEKCKREATMAQQQQGENKKMEQEPRSRTRCKVTIEEVEDKDAPGAEEHRQEIAVQQEQEQDRRKEQEERQERRQQMWKDWKGKHSEGVDSGEHAMNQWGTGQENTKEKQS